MTHTAAKCKIRLNQIVSRRTHLFFSHVLITLKLRLVVIIGGLVLVEGRVQVDVHVDVSFDVQGVDG